MAGEVPSHLPWTWIRFSNKARATSAQVHVCVRVPSCVWAEVGHMESEHTLPASPASSCSLLLLAEGRPQRLAFQCLFLSQFWQSPSPSLPPPWVSHRFSHPPPLPCPSLWSLCGHLALPTSFVISVGLLSPVLRPPGFLCLLFREVRAEPLAASS